MADDQTPAAPASRATKILLVLAAVLVIASGAVVGFVIGSGSHKHHVALPATPVPTSPVPTTPTPTPSPSTSTPPPVPHEEVAASAPTRFELKGAGFDIKATVCGMPNVRPLDPPGEQHHTVCWVREGFGVAPGTKSGTTYVLGHAWGQDDREVLNPLSSAVMREVLKELNHPAQLSGVDVFPVKSVDGYKLILKTGRGTLTYTVKSVYAVRKEQAGNIQQLMNEKIANRVVIITCGELNHVDYDYNIIVNAYLSSSVATNA